VRSCADRDPASNCYLATVVRWSAFPEIFDAIATLPEVVLDGELVVPDSAGGSDFGELQRRSLMRRISVIEDAAVRRPAALIIFDLLEAAGVDVRSTPLADRKALLAKTVAARSGLRITDGVETHGEALFAAISDGGFEGIVGKKLDSPYRAGRQPTWFRSYVCAPTR
jgi:bifunctional non-homologous end joining protein LigD